MNLVEVKWKKTEMESKPIQVEVGGETIQGRTHAINQDSFFGYGGGKLVAYLAGSKEDGRVFSADLGGKLEDSGIRAYGIVSDGVSGGNIGKHGEVASEIVVREMSEGLAKINLGSLNREEGTAELVKLIFGANSKVLEAKQEMVYESEWVKRNSMATTMTMVIVTKTGITYRVNIGDSKSYIYYGDNRLVESKTEGIGYYVGKVMGDEKLKIENNNIDSSEHTHDLIRIVVCTDGVMGKELGDDAYIKEELIRGEKSGEEAAKDLVNIAHNKPWGDDATVVTLFLKQEKPKKDKLEVSINVTPVVDGYAKTADRFTDWIGEQLEKAREKRKVEKPVQQKKEVDSGEWLKKTIGWLGEKKDEAVEIAKGMPAAAAIGAKNFEEWAGNGLKRSYDKFGNAIENGAARADKFGDKMGPSVQKFGGSVRGTLNKSISLSVKGVEGMAVAGDRLTEKIIKHEWRKRKAEVDSGEWLEKVTSRLQSRVELTNEGRSKVKGKAFKEPQPRESFIKNLPKTAVGAIVMGTGSRLIAEGAKWVAAPMGGQAVAFAAAAGQAAFRGVKDIGENGISGVMAAEKPLTISKNERRNIGLWALAAMKIASSGVEDRVGQEVAKKMIGLQDRGIKNVQTDLDINLIGNIGVDDWIKAVPEHELLTRSVNVITTLGRQRDVGYVGVHTKDENRGKEAAKFDQIQVDLLKDTKIRIVGLITSGNEDEASRLIKQLTKAERTKAEELLVAGGYVLGKMTVAGIKGVVASELIIKAGEIIRGWTTPSINNVVTTPEPSASVVPAHINEVVPTKTPTPTGIFRPEATATILPTHTAIPTVTATELPTHTPVPMETLIPTNTATATVTATPIPTVMPTAVPGLTPENIPPNGVIPNPGAETAKEVHKAFIPLVKNNYTEAIPAAPIQIEVNQVEIPGTKTFGEFVRGIIGPDKPLWGKDGPWAKILTANENNTGFWDKVSQVAGTQGGMPATAFKELYTKGIGFNHEAVANLIGKAKLGDETAILKIQELFHWLPADGGKLNIPTDI